jgi:hypothetical protein
MNLLQFTMLAILLLQFCCKNKKVIARKLGAKCKGDKTCIWVPKTIITNCRRFGPGGVPGPMSKFIAACPCPDGLVRDGTQVGE